MELLSTANAYVAWFLLAALAAIVGYRMLTGRIVVAGILRDKERGEISPVRVQMLLFTLVGAAAYFSLVVEAIANGASALPKAPEMLLLLMGGSQATYLAGKSYQKFLK